MLGNAVTRVLSGIHDVIPLDRRTTPDADILNKDYLRRALDHFEPEAVINCVGIVKSECDKHDARRVLMVNGAAPHMIADLCLEHRCRLIHISTDCVFDGSRGLRTEADSPDATDLYGRSKALGEIRGQAHCLTLRLSFIGRDKVRGRGLLEWLLRQEKQAIGYQNAIWSGSSSLEVARVIARALLDPHLFGLYNVACQPISKAELLRHLVASFKLPLQVTDASEPIIDRSLDGALFNKVELYKPPTWEEMAEELARSP